MKKDFNELKDNLNEKNNNLKEIQIQLKNNEKNYKLQIDEINKKTIK